MSGAKHTPGPWAWDGEGRIDSLPLRKPSPYKLKDKDGVEHEYIEGLVALPYGSGEPGSMEANARLIAAAPRLLQALQAAQSALLSYQYGNDSGELAREVAANCGVVIAEATGSAA